MSLQIVINCNKCSSSLHIVGQPTVTNGLVVISVTPCAECIPEITTETTTDNNKEHAVSKKSKPTTGYLDTLLAKKEPQTNREHILKALSVKIQTPIPDDGRAYEKWEKGLDSLIGECRSHSGKKRLDKELTNDIMAAIRAAKSEKGGFPFETSDQPHTAVVARIVKAFRNREWVVASPYAGVRDL